MRDDLNLPFLLEEFVKSVAEPIDAEILARIQQELPSSSPSNETETMDSL
jgi:hypothetical protein